MTDDLVRLAKELADFYRPPRWKFWKRQTTSADTLKAIEAALTGDPNPIQVFGILVKPNTHRIRILNRIQTQIDRQRAKF